MWISASQTNYWSQPFLCFFYFNEMIITKLHGVDIACKNVPVATCSYNFIISFKYILQVHTHFL